MSRPEWSSNTQHLIDSQDVQKIEWFKQGVEDALNYGSDGDRCDEIATRYVICYHEGYEYGMYRWSQYLDEERYTQGALSNPPCREVKDG